jgi:DNA-binding transcriptional MerR regulator
VILADTQAIAVLTGRSPATIRSWAHRGLISRKGTDRKGRALYDVDGAQALARHLDNQRKRVQHQERMRTTAP